MAYIDANVFMYAIAKDSPHHEACMNLLDAVARGNISATTSALTWDEVAHGTNKLKGAITGQAAGKMILEMPRLKIIAVDRKTISLAQTIHEKANSYPRDSIHAACAILAGESEIYSFDSDFDKVKELKRKEPK